MTPQNTKDQFYIKTDGFVKLSTVTHDAAVYFGTCKEDIIARFEITAISFECRRSGIGVDEIEDYILIFRP